MAGKTFSVTAILGVNSKAMAMGLRKAGTRMALWAKKTMARVVAAVKAAMLLAAAAVGVFAYKSIKEFASFEKRMLEVFTLMPTISRGAMAKMEGDVLKLAKTMGILPEKVVPALYQAISAGVPAENVFTFLEVAAKASIGGVTSLETAVDGLTGVINAYGKENMSAARASDIMFTAVKLGKTTFEEMARSLGDATPLASALGISFEELAAALATSTSITGNTAKSVTGLKNLMGELGKKGQVAAKHFERITGKTFPQFIASGGTMKQALEAMKAEADRTGGSIMDFFGGIESGQMALQLTESGAIAFAGAVTEMGNSAGASQAAFQRMDAGLARSFSKIIAAFKVVMVRFGKALAPVVEKITPVIMKIINQIDSINWAALINGFARVWVIGLKPTFDAIGRALQGLPWIDLYRFMLPIASLVIKTIQKIGKIIVGLSPVIIPLLTTLAGYFVMLYGKFFLVVHFLSKMAPQIGAVFKELLSIVSAVMGFIINPSAAKFKWLVEYIKKRFSNLGGATKGLFARMWEIIKETLGKIGGVLKIAFNMFVEGMWQSIVKFLKKWPNVWKAVGGLVRMFKTMKHEIAAEIMALKDAFSGMFGGVENGGEAMDWLQKTIKWLSKSLGELIELTIKYSTALMKVLGVIIKVVIRLLTQLAPALKEIIPVALKIAAAAVFFLMEGVKVLFWVFKLWLGMVIQLIKWLAYLEPVLMLIVDVVSGFVAAVVEGIKAIWSLLVLFYKFCKEGWAKYAEFAVTAFYKIKDIVDTVIDFIIGLFKKLKGFVWEVLFGGTITKDFKAAFEFIEKLVMRVLKGIFKIFKEFNKIAKTVLLGVAHVFETIFSGIEKVVESLGRVVKSVFDSIGNLIDKISNAFLKMAKVIERIFGKVLELGGKAIKLAGKAAGFVGGAVEGVGDFFGVGGGKKPKGVRPQVSSAGISSNVKQIVRQLDAIERRLIQINTSLKGKFTNQ